MLHNIVSSDFVPSESDERQAEHMQEMQAEHASNMDSIRGWLVGKPDCEECSDSGDMEFDGKVWTCTYCKIEYAESHFGEEFEQAIEGQPEEWGLELTPVWTLKTETGFLLHFSDTEDYLQYCQKHGQNHEDGELMVWFLVSTGGPGDGYLLEVDDKGYGYTGATYKYLPWFAGYCAGIGQDESDLVDFFNMYFSPELLIDQIESMWNEYAELQYDYMSGLPACPECGDNEDVEESEDGHTCLHCDTQF